jgi:ATP-dependent Clp protease ATP-binding subunit ClpA
MHSYNFTERVRKVLALTRNEASHLGHGDVDTEHMLLALLAEGEGVASTVLQNLAVDPDALRSHIFSSVKPGKGPTGPDLPYTSRAKKVLELAMIEARELNHTYVGTEHLLLGLLGARRGIAAKVLVNAGITLDKARVETLRVLTESSSPPRTTEPGISIRERAVIEFLSRNAAARHHLKSERRLSEIIEAAHVIAVEHQSPVIAPTHLAIALLQHQGGMANAALERLDFDRGAALSALNQTAPRGATPVDPEATVTLAPESETAFKAVQKLRHQANAASAGSHHLLLALMLTSPEVNAAFAGQNVDADLIRESLGWISG